jgi:hypothetical protein
MLILTPAPTLLNTLPSEPPVPNRASPPQPAPASAKRKASIGSTLYRMRDDSVLESGTRSSSFATARRLAISVLSAGQSKDPPGHSDVETAPAP